MNTAIFSYGTLRSGRTGASLQRKVKLAIELFACICAVILGGCVSWSVAHSSADGSELLTMTKSTHGIVLGPCLSAGGSYVAAEITLYEKKDRYSDGEYRVSFPGYVLTSGPFAQQVSGTLQVDWRHRTVVIDLQQWTERAPQKQPSWINGEFSFKDKI